MSANRCVETTGKIATERLVTIGRVMETGGVRNERSSTSCRVSETGRG
jgi:hypothetical protein